MRKAIAIFFLVIHVYNLIGYKAVFAFLQEKAGSSLAGRIDKGQFSEDELIELKVPSPQLYHQGWTEYVRYDGHIDINGERYNYVKRRFAHDTLYLMCLPNKATTWLASAERDHIGSVGDHRGDHHNTGSRSQMAKAYSTDYDHFPGCYAFACPDKSTHFPSLARPESLPESEAQSCFRPPRA